MKASKRKILLLMMIMLLLLIVVLSISCARNKSAEEDQHTDLEEPRQEADQSAEAQNDGTEPLLSEDRAMEIVLEKVPGATKEHFSSFGKEYDDGRWIYEGDIRYDGLEYDFEIDAKTGNLLEWEIDD